MTTRCQGARLVPGDRVNAAGGFQRFSVSEEDAQSGGAARARRDRRRCRQAQGAGAGDDQDRDGTEHRGCPTRTVAEYRPGDEGDNRDQHDDRDKDTGDPVCETLNRRLRCLRPLDRLRDSSQRRLRTDLGSAVREGSIEIERPCEHIVTDRFPDRHALAGQHRFVDRAVAGRDHTVDGNLLAGPHPHAVTDGNIGGGNVTLEPVLYDASRLWSELEQSRQSRRGAQPDPGLQGPTEADEADDDQRRVEEHIARRVRTFQHAGGECRDCAVSPGGGHTENDQGVHVRGPARSRKRRPPNHRPQTPGQGGRCDGEEDREDEVLIPTKLGPAIRLHRKEDPPAGDQRRQRSAELSTDVHGVGCGLLGPLVDQLISCAANGGGDASVVQYAVELDDRASGNEVRRCLGDAVNLDQRTLHTAHAGGAMHAVDSQGLGLRFGRRRHDPQHMCLGLAIV